MNAWVLTNIPSPYQTELLHFVSCGGVGELAIRFMRRIAQGTPSTIGRADVQYMKAYALSRNRDEVALHPQAIRECWRGDWSAFVLSGTIASPTLLLCCLALHLRRKTWILWLERPHPSSDKAPWGPRLLYRGPARWIRNLVMNWLLRNCTGLIAIGSQARQEYISLGVEPSKVRSLSYCCNTSRFNGELEDEAKDSRRSALGLQNRTVLLFSGQLIERKGVRQLLSIFERVAAKRPEVALLILGDGPLRKEIEAFQARTNLVVVTPGHLPQSELPKWFKLSDLFLFPSRHDGWGVVVNEACAAGLPCVVSSQTGAAQDLVRPGENGYVFDWWEEEKWTDATIALIDDPTLRQKMGGASRKLAEANSAEARAATFWKCIEDINAGHS